MYSICKNTVSFAEIMIMKVSCKVSVCLACYNGENYIEEQLNSILVQLAPNDEVIISDDCSTDNTFQIVKGIKDSRITLVQNKNGKGVIQNFENAISKASGDIVFLADQDDIWREDKVSTILDYFKENETVTCVFSNALIIDKEGVSTGTLFFPSTPKIDLFNLLIKNKFLGCTMAFRANNQLRILPFSKNLPMHDWFIGLRHVLKGKVAFINENLIYYRRHGQNVTTGKSANLMTILKWRFILLKSLVKF
ncbi:MAG: glycosyltransferase family 2 protein [Pedobacter sp.]|nr:MAG: glycosyltransferase family 2 protein [Pedobacter sp.]